MPTAPAIANALARAIGVRLKELPLTPERIRAAIAGAEAAVERDIS
jgi:CO/xanthine dehydrogenase Mo-binding subunit